MTERLKSIFVTFYLKVSTHLKLQSARKTQLTYSILEKLTCFDLNHNSTFANDQSKIHWEISKKSGDFGKPGTEGVHPGLIFTP